MTTVTADPSLLSDPFAFQLGDADYFWTDGTRFAATWNAEPGKYNLWQDGAWSLHDMAGSDFGSFAMILPNAVPTAALQAWAMAE